MTARRAASTSWRTTSGRCSSRQADLASPVEPGTVEVEDGQALRAAVREPLDLEGEAVVVGSAARRDEHEGVLASRVVECPAQAIRGLAVEIHRRRGLEDDQLRALAAVAQERRQRLDVVALHQLRRVAPHHLDRAAKALETVYLIRPDER